MTSWELIGLAVQNGIKIRRASWDDTEYVYYSKKENCWVDNFGQKWNTGPLFIENGKWEEYVEPKKEPEYLYEYAVKTLDERWYISPHPSPLEQIKKDQVGQKFKLLRKFDPDTLEEIIEDQNAKD